MATPRLSRKPADVLRRCGITQDTAVARIVRRIERCTDGQLDRGQHWYDEAHEFAELLSRVSGHSVVRCASVIAHLSPKTQWYPNVSFATALLLGDRDRQPGETRANLDRALTALDADDPLSTFLDLEVEARSGLKTSAFVRNILGEEWPVTVDVWGLRVLGMTENHLKKPAVYQACAHAYRLAGRRVGMTPRTTQATAWVQIVDERGKWRKPRTKDRVFAF